ALSAAAAESRSMSQNNGAGGAKGGARSAVHGALRAQGKDIVDAAGQVVVLKGFGLGGWLVPEGYMLGNPGGKDSPRGIRAAIEAKISVAKASDFFATYQRNYVTEADIQAIARWGFNSVRLPLNANSLMPEAGQPKVAPYRYDEAGFKPIDDLVRWCRAAGLYVILDLHAAPGAQSAHNIADSDGEARLWSEPEVYWPRTVDLWLELAARYRAEPLVIGYDLLNEPMLPGAEIGHTSQSNGPWAAHDNRPLRALYVAITQALRAAGDHKIVFPEAGFWAMNFKDLLPPWDDNLVYSFHFYPPPTGPKFFESADSTPSFGPIFEANVPLWMGETGEWRQDWIKTRADWLADNRRSVEFMATANRGHAISWSWWTTKKFGRETQPWSCQFPAEYSALLEHWDSASSADAELALGKFAHALSTSECTYHADLVQALGGSP
ncbi:MAG TPA: cellulase family glycosylhydrolase, partial [Polyangiaceae bacterium]|nr:cellulase family glycosylhydrolase [Polyangiaceae bacterium]